MPKPLSEAWGVGKMLTCKIRMLVETLHLRSGFWRGWMVVYVVPFRENKVVTGKCYV